MKIQAIKDLTSTAYIGLMLEAQNKNNGQYLRGIIKSVEIIETNLIIIVDKMMVYNAKKFVASIQSCKSKYVPYPSNSYKIAITELLKWQQVVDNPKRGLLRLVLTTNNGNKKIIFWGKKTAKDIIKRMGL